jgi:hypothetical protein
MALLIIVFLCAGELTAQTPQYYNFNTGSSGNSFPFNMAGGKAVNSLFAPGEFNQPTPIPPGQKITTVYFRHSGAGTRTYTDLRILMAQDVITTLTSATFYPGPYDTVYYNASATLTHTVGGWTSITLDHPFNYDPTKSLILFVGQCGATGTGGSVYNTTTTGIRRVWSVGGCPFVAYAGGDAATVNFGVDVVPAAPSFTFPDLLYYKFKNNTAGFTPNFAVPGVGTNPAPVVGAITSGGQFDSALLGSGVTGNGVTPGWNLALGTSSWTISMWMEIPTSTSGSAYYMFGDPGSGSFRCFHNGVAGSNNIILRGTGITDVLDSNIGPTPTVVHFVYDSAASVIKVYNNGIFKKSVAQTPLNIVTGTGFKVGGYSTSANLIGKLDEFRFYKRKLDSAEIANTWNQNLGVITGITPISTQIPNEYKLSQNYPNPFNPVTKINYSLPKSGFVTMKVYDMLGREVVKLINENKVAGDYSFDFNASSLTSGVYFYRLEVNGFVDTKKMMLLK